MKIKLSVLNNLCAFLCALLLCLSYLHTTSAVATEWVQIGVPTSSSTSSFLSVSYSSEFNAVAAAQSGTGSTIVRSVDNGLTWVSSTYSGGTFGFIYDITSKTIGGTTYYLGIDDGGVVYRSLDNGVTWTNVATVALSGYGISIGTNGNAYVAGTSFRVYTSTSASNYVTWTAKSPTGITPLSNFYDISTYDGTKVIAVAYRGFIYYTTNAGTSWTKATVGIPATTVIVYCVDHGSADVAMVRINMSFENQYLSRR